MISAGHLVTGTFSRSVFLQSAEILLQRHQALRSVFKIKNGIVNVAYTKHSHFKFEQIEPTDQCFEAFRAASVPLVFSNVDPQERGSLFRLIVADYGSSWRFSVAAHHAISDGLSRNLINKELLKIYTGETLTPTQSFSKFVETENSFTKCTVSENNFIQNFPSPKRLVGDSADRSVNNNKGLFIKCDFGDLTREIRDFRKSTQSTNFGLFAGVYAMGLSGFSGSHANSISFQSEGRRALGAPNSLVGPFSRTLPLNVTVDLEMSFSSFAKNLVLNSRNAIQLEYTADIVGALNSSNKTPTFALNLFPPVAPIYAGGLIVGEQEFLDRRTEFDLNLVWTTRHKNTSAYLYFDGGQFTTTRAKLFLDYQKRLLNTVLMNPDLTCREIIAEARRNHLSVLQARSDIEDLQEKLHTKFFSVAKINPKATAIKTSSEELSYDDLKNMAMKVTASIQAAGVGRGEKIVVYGERNPFLVAMVLGISASGASFSIMDSTLPTYRCLKIIETLGRCNLMTWGKMLPTELETATNIIELNAPCDDAKIYNGPPRAAAYYLFTSGSTGVPKLVAHPDQTIVRFINWQSDLMGVSRKIITPMMSGLSHDPTLRDIFLPLSTGGTIVIPTNDQLYHPPSLRKLIFKCKCNIIRLSTSTARLLNAGTSNQFEFSYISGIFWGGEKFSPTTAREWRNLAPKARHFHIFATTETPQALLMHEVSEQSFSTRNLPIGKPVPWCGVRLLDKGGNPVSTGEVGEIVAELSDPVIGANYKYTSCGISEYYQHASGDLGYQDEKGQLFFIGRKDDQVKLNDHRIELGELESLLEHLEVNLEGKAVIIDQAIHLFINEGPEIISTDTLKAEFANHLPNYMVPAHIHFVQSFPITKNGKVDIRTLIKVAKDQSSKANNEQTGLQSPTTPNEIIVRDIFHRVTGQSNVTREHSLADLGADSISTIEAKLSLDKYGFETPENWEWLSIKYLALNRSSKAQRAAGIFDSFRTTSIQNYHIIKVLALICILAIHSGMNITVGGSITLIAIAGFAFGKNMLMKILVDGHVTRIWSLITQILLALIPASLIYYGTHLYLGNEPHISVVLPYGNLTNLVDFMLGNEAHEGVGPGWLWYIHLYLQIFALLSIPLSSIKLRKLISLAPWYSALIALTISQLIYVTSAALLYFASQTHNFSEIAMILHRSPIAILPFFFSGVLFSTAKGIQQIVISICLGICLFIISQYATSSHKEWMWLAGLIICLLFPRIRIPKLLAQAIVFVSFHALVIYLSHVPVIQLLNKLFDESFPIPASILVQLSFGIALGIIFSSILQAFGITRLTHSNNLHTLFSRLSENKKSD